MVKDLSDVIKRVELEGEQKTVEDLAGVPIVIESFVARASKISSGEFASVQAVDDYGKKLWFNTGSQPVLDTLRAIEGELPVRCTVVQKKSARGRLYYTLGSAKASNAK